MISLTCIPTQCEILSPQLKKVSVSDSKVCVSIILNTVSKNNPILLVAWRNTCSCVDWDSLPCLAFICLKFKAK